MKQPGRLLGQGVLVGAEAREGVLDKPVQVGLGFGALVLMALAERVRA